MGDEIPEIYGTWEVINTSCGIHGAGYIPDFEYLVVKPNAIFHPNSIFHGYFKHMVGNLKRLCEQEYEQWPESDKQSETGISTRYLTLKPAVCSFLGFGQNESFQLH